MFTLVHVIMFGDDPLYDWSFISINFTEYATKVHILYDYRLEYFEWPGLVVWDAYS